MKRNSWFILKYDHRVALVGTKWLYSMPMKQAKRLFAEGSEQVAISAEMSTHIHEEDARVYWREDWEKVDELESDSAWTPYRREALKFQKRADAEVFAFERTKLFPPFIGLIHVERLCWNPVATGPCGYVAGPRYALAT